jgi:hypothetical protein
VPKLLLILAGIAAGILVGSWIVKAVWRLRSELRLRAAGDTKLNASSAVLWRDPGPVEARDLAAGPGGRDGAPTPPFQFIEEHTTGSHPCVSVRDARHRVWRVKWGAEVHTEVFASRLAWAAGYFVETNYFVPQGRIDRVLRRQRTTEVLDEAGHFREACFELDEREPIKHFDEESWAWNDNPFVGTRELNGLKMVMMLLSNWDNKDVRDVARGSNTAIFEYATGTTWEARYLIIDWGAALGSWGSNILSRGRWNAAAYAAQNDQFIMGIDGGPEGDQVLWGYKGQRTEDAIRGIHKTDARWLYGLLSGLTDAQLAAAIRAAGGTESEITDFTNAILDRIQRLGDISA